MSASEYNLRFARERGFAAGLPHNTPCGGVLPDSPEFEAACYIFQRRHGLTDDGAFGPKTWDLWCSLHAGSLPTDHMIVGGMPYTVPFKMRNYLDLRVQRFAQSDRKREVSQIVVHESVTRSARTCVRVLQKKGLGVHFIIDGDGTITQHADLLDDRLIHCPRWNSRSIGIEVITPYYPAYEAPPWIRRIDAPWADRHKSEPRAYLLPTLAQCRSLTNIIGHLLMCDLFPIPHVWHGVQGPHWYLGPIRDPDKTEGGIWSHQQTGTHADGSWPALVAYLESSRYPGDVERAYDCAIEMTRGAIQPIRLLSHG